MLIRIILSSFDFDMKSSNFDTFKILHHKVGNTTPIIDSISPAIALFFAITCILVIFEMPSSSIFKSLVFFLMTLFWTATWKSYPASG